MSEEKVTIKFEPEKKEFSKKIGDYILFDQIGQGTFSKVTSAVHTITEQIVAVKILDKSKIEDKVDIERINREIEILKHIYHPNICQLYETYATMHNYYLMMEYVNGGDLFDYISENSFLSEHKACYFFRQLISVMEYLSSLGISHRDIKPENILLNEDRTQIKVIDFGLSNYSDKSELLHSSCGSPCYASPEMLSGDPYWGLGTDIWSAGVVLYSMLVGGLPFDDAELKTLYEQIKGGKFFIPSTLSLEAIDLLKKILRVDPEKRIKIKEIKEHKWFNLEQNVMYKGINITYQKMPCDFKVIQYIIKNYFPEENITLYNYSKMIKEYACNKYTATYYLVKKYILKKNDLNDNNDNIKENKKEKNINSNTKNNNNNNTKYINTKNIGNFNKLYDLDENHINYNTNKIENINTQISENQEKKENSNMKIKIKRKKIENNNKVLIRNKPKIKNDKRNNKNKEIYEYYKKTENNSGLKLGLSLINITGIKGKQIISDSFTDRNIAEKCKYSNYINKIYTHTNANTNNNSNSGIAVKTANKKNKKLKTYLDKIIYPKKGDLNFYVINNIINKEKQGKKKRAKNENIIVNINNNNNYINHSMNRNNHSIEQGIIISPKNNNKSRNNKLAYQLTKKEEMKYTTLPRNKLILRKTEKNSPKKYFKLDLFTTKKRKTVSPINDSDIKANNKHSNLIKFNTNVLNYKKKEKGIINKTNYFVINKGNKNVINKDKLKQEIINHRKIKSLYKPNQNNILFNYFHESKKNNENNHKRNISSVLKSQSTHVKTDINTTSNRLNTITGDKKINLRKNNETDNTLSYSEEKFIPEKIMNKAKNKGPKKKIINLNIQNNKTNELNSFIFDKLKRNKLIISNNTSRTKNNNQKNNINNNYYIRLGQSNSTNNYFLTDDFHNNINKNVTFNNNILFNN